MPRPKKPARLDNLITCPGHGEGREPHDLPPSAFYTDKGRSTGYSRLCRECHKAKGRSYFKGYYQEHKDAIIEAVGERRQKAKREKAVPAVPAVPAGGPE